MTRIIILSTEFRHDFTDSRIVNSRVSHPAGHLSRAKAPRCLYVEIHAQRAYFAAFVQFAKQEDVNLHMKNLASFASLRADMV